MYDSDNSNIRNTKTNWCLGQLFTNEKWNDKDKNEISFTSYNDGIFPCNSKGFEKRLKFE